MAPERSKKYTGNLLKGYYDEDYLQRVGLVGRTTHRRARYWCFKIHFAVLQDIKMPLYPKGFKTFIESLPGFAGWEYFAHTWDLAGDNPFYVVLRLQSVWEEWDAVMNRIAIPIDAPPAQISARIQALTDEYARKESKKRR